jgi:hypothetical protein
MLDFLWQPGSETPVAIAAWSIVVAAVTTFVLIAYTLGLRVATVIGDHRRRFVIARWRSVFAGAMLSDVDAREVGLPRYSRRQRTDLLEEWNSVRACLDGDAVDNLIVAAQRLNLHKVARRMLSRHRVSTQLLAMETLGNMRDGAEWDRIAGFVRHPNTALSVTAAKALAQIDRRRAAELVVPQVIERADWPPATAARILSVLGPELITQPLCQAILMADQETAVHLLRFAGLLRPEALERLVEEVIRTRDEPPVLSAVLQVCPDQAGAPRITALAQHPVWYVRMQAAKLLGRVGQPRDVPVLERLLADREWWVRYRAAQALVSLPFLGPAGLRALKQRLSDPFAADMMSQAMAEAGTA